jgi:hypothetical protein
LFYEIEANDVVLHHERSRLNDLVVGTLS